MRRSKSSRLDGTILLLLIIVGIPVFLFQKLVETLGQNEALLVIFGVVAAFITWRILKGRASAQQQQRLEEERAKEYEERKTHLLEKYKNEKVVEMILNKLIWRGESAEQVKESLGQPLDIDSKLMKTRKREVWKYNHQGINRYGLRITLDNGIVVGWDQKN